MVAARKSFLLGVAGLGLILGVFGCTGSAEPEAKVGEITTSKAGEAQVKSGKPMTGAARPSLD